LIESRNNVVNLYSEYGLIYTGWL